ncbi:MAG: hypothetical protein ACRBHB_22130 [Arenicella sp.]
MTKKTPNSRSKKSPPKSSAGSSASPTATFTPAGQSLQQIMQAIDDNLKRSELSIQTNLQEVYRLIDSAKTTANQLEHAVANPIDNAGVAPATISQQTQAIAPESGTPHGATGNTAVHSMQAELEIAQQAMHKSMLEANQQVQQASDLSAATQADFAAQAQHELPQHLQNAMDSVQQSINNTAALINQNIAQKNDALQQQANAHEAAAAPATPPSAS